MFDMFGDVAPVTRADCKGKSRPCPWIRCVYNMVWVLSQQERSVMSDDDFVEKIMTLPETCVLDICDHGGNTLQEIADILGVSRERIRQVEGLSDKEYIRKGISSLKRSPKKMRTLVAAWQQEY